MDTNNLDVLTISWVIRRQWRLITSMVTIVSTVALCVAFTLMPIYSAGVLVIVDGQQPNLLEQLSGLGGGPDSATVEGEVEMIRSSNVMLRVIEELDLSQSREFKSDSNPFDQALGLLPLHEHTELTADAALQRTVHKLSQAVSVSRLGLTQLIWIDARSQSPELAARIANSVAKAYIETQIASKSGELTLARDVLRQHASIARQSVGSTESAFDHFIRDNIIRLGTQEGRIDLAHVRRQLRELAEARGQTIPLAQTVQQEASIGHWEDLISSLQSEASMELERQRLAMAASIVDQEVGSTAGTNLREEIANLEESLRSEATAELPTLRAEVATRLSNEQALHEQLRLRAASGGLTPDDLTALYELQQNADLARRRYQTLLRRIQLLDVQSSLQQPDSRIVSFASAPSRASFPNRTMIVGGAAGLALLIGVVTAFLRDGLVGGFVSRASMLSALGLETVAIPLVKDLSGGTPADLSVINPVSPFPESIRRIRTTARVQAGSLACNGGDKGLVVVVTSTNPSDGASTTALALARSYVEIGRSTLLIDCDLRKPSLHRYAKVSAEHCVRDILMFRDFKAEALGLCVSDPLGNLVLIPTTPSNEASDEFFAMPAFERLMSWARQTFEVIILDGPPIASITDCLYLAPFADVIVLVARSGATSQSEVEKSVGALSSYKRAESIILGALIGG